ncbi:hypothetical protein T492DRAFT_471293 [Pavlovales sp. CCMP2436]|nr:hypothetical protein T492DRAFT_471293 [Pavlovales sp. CCMP2436]
MKCAPGCVDPLPPSPPPSPPHAYLPGSAHKQAHGGGVRWALLGVLGALLAAAAPLPASPPPPVKIEPGDALAASAPLAAAATAAALAAPQRSPLEGPARSQRPSLCSENAASFESALSTGASADGDVQLTNSLLDDDESEPAAGSTAGAAGGPAQRAKH